MKKTPLFTDAELEIIQAHAYAIWSECAYDILQAVADEKGKSVDEVSVSRAVAMEVSIDAGRLEERMRHDGRVSVDLVDRVRKADYKTIVKAVRPAFPFVRYGT